MKKQSSTSFRFSSLLFFFIVAAFINVAYSEDEASIVVNSAWSCSYMFTVRTGPGGEAGTDSRISVTLGNSDGQQVEIPDLKEWGTMPPGHDYFESGNRDTFSVKADCFPAGAQLCKMTVTSDGSGQKPGWFLIDVAILMRNPTTLRTDTSIRTEFNFDFSQWLAKDEPPNELTASVNECK